MLPALPHAEAVATSATSARIWPRLACAGDHIRHTAPVGGHGNVASVAGYGFGSSWIIQNTVVGGSSVPEREPMTPRETASFS